MGEVEAQRKERDLKRGLGATKILRVRMGEASVAHCPKAYLEDSPLTLTPFPVMTPSSLYCNKACF